jgi:hypothetical protein
MSNSYDRPPRCTATGVMTASILAVSLAMAASLMFDWAPAPADTAQTTAQAVSGRNG